MLAECLCLKSVLTNKDREEMVHIFLSVCVIWLKLLFSFSLLICDALQQNREQVAQVYFEIWAIELWHRVKK